MNYYIAELTPVHAPLPAQARMFVFLEAETEAAAVSAVNALGLIRHDKAVQVDLYLRVGNQCGKKLWSGLHRVPAVRPNLVVVA